ncbi:MAG: gliding motility-associated C-terminal domain-containing protein [Lentimicrobiaceae bacterium]|nr:gliding motility-associated C-terminal domain-containing protein [Lentimicrobiaceae bacterium]
MLKKNLYPLFLILLFFSSLQIIHAQQPRLASVSVDTIFPQQIKVSWVYDQYIDSVTIYKCTQNCNIEDNFYKIAKLDMADLEWIDTLANIASQNYYSIGWQWSGKSKPQNNMVLKAQQALDGCPNSISLIWNPYINMTDTLDYYNIFYRKIEVDTPSFELLTYTKETQFTAKLLQNNSIYEFVVQAVNKNNLLFAFSNIVEDTAKVVITDPVSVAITRVSVVDDIAIEIDINTDIFPEPENFHNLYLLRSLVPNKSANFIVIDSLSYNSNNEYLFIDKDADPLSGLYYYQAFVKNQCKSNDTSNVMTNIFLWGHRIDDEKYKDSVLFYQAGVDLYEMYELLVNEKPFIDINLLNQYVIDVEKFMKDGLATTYKIQSKKFTKRWYSNTLSIPHEPVVYFPNAFYPRGADMDKSFYPIISFPSEDDYFFIIYNRWGQELYRSTLPPVPNEYNNMQGRWDGTFQGKECPAEIYAYKLSYSYNSGKGKFSRSGTFMLVR